MTAYHHHLHAANRANGPVKPLSFIGAGKRGVMAPTFSTCVVWAFEATRDSSLAQRNDEKREVDSMAEDDGT